MMNRSLLLAALISFASYAQNNEHWEQVFNTSMLRQAQAQLSNFQDLPLGVIPSSSFGMRHHPISNENKLHRGVDLPAPTGTPFKTVAHGRVIFSGEWGALGNLIVVEHNDGYVTRYGHASELYFSEGDVVRRGDILGAVGDTGLVTGSHVHFEILKDGNHLDPEVFVASRRLIQLDEIANQIANASTVDLNAYVDSMHQSETKPQLTNKSQAKRVQTGKSLWSIASNIMPLDATIYQVMFAIYELNPRSFPAGNMNKRREDIDLIIPSREHIVTTNPEQAKKKYYEDLNQLNSALPHDVIASSSSDPKYSNASL